MIKNIVFDIGNVLAGFVWEDFYKSFGFSEEVFDKLAAATVKNRLWYEIDQGNMSTEEIIRGFKEYDPSIEMEIDRVFTDVSGILELYDYAVPWVEELKGRGYSVYILSNIGEKVICDCKNRLPFLDLVDGAVLSYQVKTQKPEAKIYQLFLERFALDPGECIFIDDLERNIAAAVDLGMDGIWFNSYHQAEQELEKKLNMVTMSKL